MTHQALHQVLFEDLGSKALFCPKQMLHMYIHLVCLSVSVFQQESDRFLLCSQLQAYQSHPRLYLQAEEILPWYKLEGVLQIAHT